MDLAITLLKPPLRNINMAQFKTGVPKYTCVESNYKSFSQCHNKKRISRLPFKDFFADFTIFSVDFLADFSVDFLADYSVDFLVDFSVILVSIRL